MIRDATYGSLLKRARAQMHERFVAWAERVNRERGREEEFEEILGYHLEQAYRYRTELGPLDAAGREMGLRAATKLGNAGRRAFARSDIPAAVTLLRRSADLLGAGLGPAGRAARRPCRGAHRAGPAGGRRPGAGRGRGRRGGAGRPAGGGAGRRGPAAARALRPVGRRDGVGPHRGGAPVDRGAGAIRRRRGLARAWQIVVSNQFTRWAASPRRPRRPTASSSTPCAPATSAWPGGARPRSPT